MVGLCLQCARRFVCDFAPVKGCRIASIRVLANQEHSHALRVWSRIGQQCRTGRRCSSIEVPPSQSYTTPAQLVATLVILEAIRVYRKALQLSLTCSQSPTSATDAATEHKPRKEAKGYASIHHQERLVSCSRERRQNATIFKWYIRDRNFHALVKDR